jgi:hypothetical protein
MAQRLPRHLLLLAALVLLLAAQRSDAQSQGQPAPPPAADKPKSPEPAPAAKELSKEEVDGLIEKAFGKDSAEMNRPVRLWIADIGMAIAAEKASVSEFGWAIQFSSVSIVFPKEAKVLRGYEAVVSATLPVSQWSELAGRTITLVEVRGENSIIKFSQAVQPGTINRVRKSIETQGLTPAGPVKQGEGPTAPPEVFTGPLSGPTGPASETLEIRFSFKIDPKMPPKELLPTSPKTFSKLPLWTNEDLAKVSELTFGEQISKELPKLKAMEATAHFMAKINHLNLKKRDGFMLALIEQRQDLRGLPFLMGDECRPREEQAKIFGFFAAFVRDARAKEVGRAGKGAAEQEFWARITNLLSVENSSGQKFDIGSAHGNKEQLDRGLVAALTQIMMPESAELRTGFARFLAMIPHIDATKALAKLAIFSPEEEVRAAAIEGLKLRREKDYTDVLIQGFRYPLPAVSKRAAEALVKLERKDLLVNLIDVLESPDPRLPVIEKRDGKEVTVVRELVKINHHRNCLLCHAPGNTENTPEGVLKVAVPLPGEPLPKPSEGGYQSTLPPSPDIVVRLDMTYLRQDFAQMMPVSDAHPWPDMQRFDFLVRTRELSPAEAKTYCEDQEPGRLSPYHRSALYALRELTGRDTEPTAAAWRKLLKLAAR